MTNDDKKEVQGTNRIRIFVRIISVIVAIFVIFPLLNGYFPEHIIGKLAVLFEIAGLVIAWPRETIGGALLVFGSILLLLGNYFIPGSYFTYLGNFQDALVNSGHLLLTGMLFILSGLESRRLARSTEKGIERGDRLIKTARILSLVTLVLFFYFFITTFFMLGLTSGEGSADLESEGQYYMFKLLIIMLAFILGLMIASLKEKIGGITIIITVLGLIIYEYINTQPFETLVIIIFSVGLLLLVGILFLLGDRKAKM